MQGLKEDAIFPSDPQGWELVRQSAESGILAALGDGTLQTDECKKWRLDECFKYITDIFGQVGEKRLLSIVDEAIQPRSVDTTPTDASYSLSVNVRDTSNPEGSLTRMKHAYLQCVNDREECAIAKLDEMSHTIQFYLAYIQNSVDFRVGRFGVKERYAHLGVHSGRGKDASTQTYSWLLHEIYDFSIEDLNRSERNAPKVVSEARIKMQKRVAEGAWLATHMDKFGAGIFGFLPPTCE